MARAFSGRNYFLLAEGLMGSKRAADIIKKEKSIRAVFDMFKNINISITGIGSFYPATTSVLAKPSYISQEELNGLLAQNVVGDIILRFLAPGGKECDTELADRTISMDLEQYKKIEKKICLVSGKTKLYPVLEAMNGGLIDVLIADHELATALLKMRGKPLSRKER
jgi:DNA-binding transcriptional regulator LsrR (DeoR family)